MMNSRRRQYLQLHRSQEWIRAVHLPDSPTITAKLLAIGWIEKQGAGGDLSYRLTEAGLAAMKAQFSSVWGNPPDSLCKHHGSTAGECEDHRKYMAEFAKPGVQVVCRESPKFGETRSDGPDGP
jgi:hypothetical protein